MHESNGWGAGGPQRAALRKDAIMPSSRSRAARSTAAVGWSGSGGMAEAGMPSSRASLAISLYAIAHRSSVAGLAPSAVTLISNKAGGMRDAAMSAPSCAGRASLPACAGGGPTGSGAGSRADACSPFAGVATSWSGPSLASEARGLVVARWLSLTRVCVQPRPAQLLY